MSRPKRSTFDVFVGNLPEYVDKGYVEGMFKKCGELAGVVLMNSKFGRSKIAYGKFFCEPDALKAVEMYKHLCLTGNQLEVRKVPSKQEHTSSSVKNVPPSSNASGPNFGNNTYDISPLAGLTNASFNQKYGEDVSIVVCHIGNPTTIYGQGVTNLLEVAKVTSRLQNFCTSFQKIIGLPHINQIYASRFSQDGLWYRCRIVQTDKNKSFVSYIDYGNDEYVNNSDIVLLPDDLAKIPPQSSMFVFKDLKHVSFEENAVLYDEAIAYLKKMINEKVMVRTVFSTEGFCFVDRCFRGKTDVYEELQKKGYAVKVPSTNEKYNSYSKKRKFLGNASFEKNMNYQPNPKAAVQQNSNFKANYQNQNSFPKTDHTVKADKKNLPKNKDVPDEVKKLHSWNDKLKKELNAEKEKSRVLAQQLEALKAKSDSNYFGKLDSVIMKTQQLFRMRSQNPSENTSNLEDIYDVIKDKVPGNVNSLKSQKDLHCKVEEALSSYVSSIKEVSECSEDYQHFIQKRDEACKIACDAMKGYMECWNGDMITEEVDYLKKHLHELELKYKKYLNMDVKCDQSLDELITMYKDNKVKSKEHSEETIKNTTEALNHFASIVDDLKKDMTSSCDEFGKAGNSQESDVSVRFSTKAFTDSLKQVEEAVDAEIIAKSTQPKAPLKDNMLAVLVKTLTKEVQTPLEEALREIEGYKRYEEMYPKMCHNLKTKPDTSKIYEIRKELKALKSKIRHKLADKKDMEESDEVNATALTEMKSALDSLLWELHSCFEKEHDEMMKLVIEFRGHFPELKYQNPDLNLVSYSKYNGLVKDNWELEHFNIQSIKRPGTCYCAQMCDVPVVVKEYHISTDEEESFFNKIMLWHSIEDDGVVQIKAVFRSKTGSQTYAVFSRFATLEESLKECPLSQHDAALVLCDILKGLEKIHSHGLVHSLLNPSTILIRSDKSTVLDYSFGISPAAAVWETKGVKFCPPEKELYKASDMYNFGCLILWMLFPNLQFVSSNGKPDITGYKSIVRDQLSNHGFEALKALLSGDPSARPTAKSLLAKNIFAKLIQNKSGINPPCSSTSVSEEILTPPVQISEEKPKSIPLTVEEKMKPDSQTVVEEIMKPDSQTVEEKIMKPDSQTVEEKIMKPDSQTVEEEIMKPDSQTVEEKIMKPDSQTVEEEIMKPDSQTAEDVTSPDSQNSEEKSISELPTSPAQICETNSSAETEQPENSASVR